MEDRANSDKPLGPEEHPIQIIAVQPEVKDRMLALAPTPGRNTQTVPLGELGGWIESGEDGICIPEAPGKRIGFVLSRMSEEESRSMAGAMGADVTIDSETATDWILQLGDEREFLSAAESALHEPPETSEVAGEEEVGSMASLSSGHKDALRLLPGLGMVLAHVNLHGLMLLLALPGWTSVEADAERWSIKGEKGS